MKFYLTTLLLFSFLILTAQQQPGIGYRFDRPQLVSLLPDELEEISGLSLDETGRYLLAVEDENGRVYFLDRTSGRIEKTVDFWKDGDYEGIEAVGEEVYVVKNTGTLYRISNIGTDAQSVEKYNDFLTDDNDVEGLAWDARQQRLLLACKAAGDDGADAAHERCIFAFDPRTGQLDPEPVVVIRRDDVKAYLRTAPRVDGYEKLCEFFIEEEEYELSPSSLAVHPLTGDLYLTSSRGKILMVVRPDGSIRHVEKLRKEQFPQPEGLCFAADGTLYLSSEGRKGPALIYRLPYQPEGR